MIDLDHMPPDWQFAENHAKAVKPGLADNIHIQNSKNLYCTCCLKPIIKQPLSLWSNSKQLEFLGFGFPLYFIFIKYCIILLLILICSYSFISLYWAIKDNQSFCGGSHRLLSGGQAICTSFMIRFAHIESEVSDTEMMLRISSFILHIATLIYIRDHIQKTKQYYDEKTTTFSDYSLVFKNLPLTDNIQKKIRRFIDEYFIDEWKQLQIKYSGQEFKNDKKVVQITLIPHTNQFYELIQQKKILIEQKRKIVMGEEKKNQNTKIQDGSLSQLVRQNRKQLENEGQITEFPVSIKIINQKIKQKSNQIDSMCHLFQDMASKDILPSEIAIVVLNTQIFKNIILEHVEEGKLTQEVFQKYFGEQALEIQIHQAPEPSEIIWQNVNYPISKRLGRKVIGWSLTLIFLVITTIGFYFLLLLKTNNLLHAIQDHDDNKYKIAIFLVFLSLFLIIFFNKLFMGWVLHHFAHLERHDNTFQEEFSFALKYTLGLFFTTALMTLAVEAITFHNFYSHEYGVIEQESIMFFINAFFIPLFWFINPWQLTSLIKRKLYKNTKFLTQNEANNIMSDTNYTMGKRYAEIIETMWFTFLYASLIPFGAFLTIIGLSLYYWVDKFNLLRRSSLKNNISGKMAIRSLKLLDLTLLLRPLGELLFDTQMRHDYIVATIVFIVIGALYFILPMGDILQFFHEQKFKQQQKSFEQVKDKFMSTYETLHPIFGYKSSVNMIQKFKERTSKEISLSKIELNDFNNQQKIAFTNNQTFNGQLNQDISSLDMTLRLIPNNQSSNKLKTPKTPVNQEKKRNHQNISNSNENLKFKSDHIGLVKNKKQDSKFSLKKNQVANQHEHPQYPSIDRNLIKHTQSLTKFNQEHKFAQDQFSAEPVFKTDTNKRRQGNLK